MAKKNTRRNQRPKGGAKMISPFTRVPSDTTTLRLRGILSPSVSGVGVSAGFLSLTPTLTGGTSTLGDLVAALPNIATNYEQFMVHSVKVRVIPTVTTATGTLVAVGYEPSYDGVEVRTPTTFNDVVVSQHHVLTNQIETKSFGFNADKYQNDWCYTSATASSQKKTAGYIQWLTTTVGGSPPAIFYFYVQFVISFCGLHV